MFAALEDGVPAESVMRLYPRLMRETARCVAGYVGDAPFSDIGTPADYLRPRCELAGARRRPPGQQPGELRVDPTARVDAHGRLG